MPGCVQTGFFFFQLRYYPGTAIVEKALEKGFISTEDYEKILNAGDEGGICVKEIFSKKDLKEINFKKIKMLLFSMDVLSGRLIDFIVKKRLYRLWPSFFDESIFMLFRTLLSRDIDSRIRFDEAFLNILQKRNFIIYLNAVISKR